MMHWRLKIAESDCRRLQELVFADMPKEAGAFALAGVSLGPATHDILVRRIVEIPKALFTFQHAARLEVAPSAVNGLVALCEANRLGAVICHSHPAPSDYSPSDDHGERRIADALRPFLSNKAPIASLLLFPGGMKGRVWVAGDDTPKPLSQVIVVGKQLQDTGLSRSSMTPEFTHDRQVRAFGLDGQRRIADCKVAVVGTGGTGSPVAEQLARLGVTDLVLADPDRIDATSPTRVYGVTSRHLKRPWWRRGWQPPFKVALLAEHLRQISPGIRVLPMAENVVGHSAARSLLDRDIVFLCTDEHWGRSIVNQLAYQYLIPTINLGVRIDSRENRIHGAVGVIDVLRPDTPCLWCRGFLRADRITAESLPAGERRAREEEGYVENIDAPAPSVVSLTTTVAGMGVTMWLQLLTGFMRNAGNVHRLNYDVMTGTVRRGRCSFVDGCICGKVKGRGDCASLPTVDESAIPGRG